MYEFTRWERELEPQPSGSRFGPPRKRTAADLLDPAQFPPIRPRCFGCLKPLAIAEIGQHILNCERVSVQDLARFKIALAEFNENPDSALEVLERFLTRIRSSRE